MERIFHSNSGEEFVKLEVSLNSLLKEEYLKTNIINNCFLNAEKSVSRIVHLFFTRKVVFDIFRNGSFESIKAILQSCQRDTNISHNYKSIGDNCYDYYQDGISILMAISCDLSNCGLYLAEKEEDANCNILLDNPQLSIQNLSECLDILHSILGKNYYFRINFKLNYSRWMHILLNDKDQIQSITERWWTFSECEDALIKRGCLKTIEDKLRASRIRRISVSFITRLKPRKNEVSSSLCEFLIENTDTEGKQRLLESFPIPEHIQKKYAKRNGSYRWCLARNDFTKPEILSKLAEDAAAHENTLRNWIACNPNTSDATLTLLSIDSSEHVRKNAQEMLAQRK